MPTTQTAPPWLNAQTGDTPSPYSYTVPGTFVVEPASATATFDGSGASGPFLAALSFYAQSGQLITRVYPQISVGQGEVANVSFAPFPGGMTSGPSPGGGIQYDTDNEGDWLQIGVTGSAPNPLGDLVGVGIHKTVAGSADIDVLLDAYAQAEDGLATALNVNAVTTGSGLAQAATILAESAGGNNATGMFLAGQVDTGPGDGVGLSVNGTTLDAAEAGAAVGIRSDGETRGSGAATGIAASATSSGSGDAVGVDVNVSASGGGAAIPIQATIAAVPIFRIDAAGNIHIPVAASVINDL